MDDPREVFAGAKVMLFLGDAMLVLRRDHTPGIPWPGCLDLPGGGREGDETPEQCAIRETQEEVGLILRKQDLILAHLRDLGLGASWFFATHLPESRAADIRFGGEGAGWELMAPEAFADNPEAVPHFREILGDYLDKKSAGKRSA